MLITTEIFSELGLITFCIQVANGIESVSMVHLLLVWKYDALVLIAQDQVIKFK